MKLPQSSVPSAVVLRAAVAQALRLARSAHLELGFALAIQSAWLAGRRSRTPARVHALLAKSRASLVRHFLRVTSRARSNSAEWHPPWDMIAGQVMALDQQYQDLVAQLRSTADPRPYTGLIKWTVTAGGLAHDLMGCSAGFPEFQQLYAESAMGLQGCYFLHLT